MLTIETEQVEPFCSIDGLPTKGGDLLYKLITEAFDSQLVTSQRLVTKCRAPHSPSSIVESAVPARMHRG